MSHISHFSLTDETSDFAESDGYSDETAVISFPGKSHHPSLQDCEGDESENTDETSVSGEVVCLVLDWPH